MLDRIVATEAICLHVRRRGDYVSNPTVAAYHGLAPLEYYRHGLAEAAAGLGQPHCFVFSDEPAWVLRGGAES